MHALGRFALGCGAVLALGVTACSAEPAADDEAPSAALTAVEERDQGSTYGGWTHTLNGFWDEASGDLDLTHTFTRASGDASRGGGACFVVHELTSCTDDASCTSAAKSAYGSLAYGYCYSGSCYARPGSAPTFCTTNPDRSAANGNMTLTKGATTPIVGSWSVLGCMTKAAGPSTACGGTDTSAYMRRVQPALFM